MLLSRNRALLIILTLILSFCTAEVSKAQNKLLKPGGKIRTLNTSERRLPSVLLSGTSDTLKNSLEYDLMFAAGGQDVIAGWFVCPADLKIKACGYDCGDNPAGVNIELKIVKLSSAWTLDQLQRYGSEQIGYWSGYDSSVLPFANSLGASEWIASSEYDSPFAEDVWSDDGLGAPDKPENDGDRSTYQWIQMNILGYEPQLQKGDIFAVCIKNTEPAGSENFVSFLSTNEIGYGLMKFYADGRTPGDLSTSGWWQREYMLNLAVAVEVTGDNPPIITNVEKLETTLSQGERKITALIIDDNPSGGPAGVESAVLQYSINDDSNWTEVSMSNIGEGMFEGVILGQTGGTKVTYRITAKDVSGNESISEEVFSYLIFSPTPEVNSLLVLNGFNEPDELKIPDVKYFAIDPSSEILFDWKHDIWCYGPLTSELADKYNNIIEITNSGDGGNLIIYNDDVIRQWLSTAGNRNYALMGQEWLGARYGFEDLDFDAGSFEYDVLGLTYVYNDVADTTDSVLPSRLFPVSGSLLCEALYNKFGELGIDSLRYDPAYELNAGNWIDGFNVIEGQQVDMEVETRNIAREIKSEKLACVTHRILPSGNKIAFLSLDPLAMNTNPYASDYYKFGLNISAPQIKALQWFDVQTDVDQNLTKIPAEYYLSQNYPNPFNPSTKISYSVPLEGMISLKVYNLIGEEIITLADEVKQPGNYSVVIDASKLSSGVYYYVLRSRDYTSAKKMIVLK